MEAKLELRNDSKGVLYFDGEPVQPGGVYELRGMYDSGEYTPITTRRKIDIYTESKVEA